MRTTVAAHSTDLLRELIYEVRDSFNESAQAIEEFVDVDLFLQGCRMALALATG